MNTFTLSILGCGSALPTTQHMPSAQALEIRGKLYLIDCGEGTQNQIRRYKLHFGRIHSIFISHLHGDHCFGLPGLISTLGLLGRKGDLNIYGPQGIKEFLEPILSMFCERMDYKVNIITLTEQGKHPVFEDRSIKVYAFPLKHRIPTYGYLFEEKCVGLHLDKPSADFYNVPIAAYKNILAGEDYITPEGEVIPNKRLTKEGACPMRYAYCSDTAFLPGLAEVINGVDLLYHEATFKNTEAARAKATYHSTAEQAAQIAKLCNVKNLLIGHYSARYIGCGDLLKEARAVFPQTTSADEGMVIDFRKLVTKSTCH